MVLTHHLQRCHSQMILWLRLCIKHRKKVSIKSKNTFFPQSSPSSQQNWTAALPSLALSGWLSREIVETAVAASLAFLSLPLQMLLYQHRGGRIRGRQKLHVSPSAERRERGGEAQPRDKTLAIRADIHVAWRRDANVRFYSLMVHTWVPTSPETSAQTLLIRDRLGISK